MFKKSILLSAMLLLSSVLLTNAHAKGVAATHKADTLLANENYDQAYAEYLRLGEQKQNPSALHTLALFHDLGWGRSVNKEQACLWYEKAAALNVPLALDSLGNCYEQGIHKNVDNFRAAELYQQSADLGHHYSLCKLAKLYINGQGVERNAEKGIALCRQSAEQGSIPAMLQLADIHLAANTTTSLEAALRWYSNAASYRSAEAEYKLAYMLLTGKGVKQDPIEAREWFEKAASKGYHPAYYQTALLYFNAPKHPDTGLWTEQDLAKSYLWVSAAIQRSSDKTQREGLDNMLVKVKNVMPSTWEDSLDQKLKIHLDQYPQQITSQ
jgi:TPR repeat protein